MTAPLTITAHARARFAERFPGHDFDAALIRASRIGTDTLIYESTIRRLGYSVRPDSTYYHDPVTECLFVAASDGAVVTCYRHHRTIKSERRRQAAKAARRQQREDADAA